MQSGQQDPDTQVISVQGMMPSPDDVFYSDWGFESLKTSVAQALDSLNKLAAIQVAIIAGGMVGIKADVMSPISKLWMLGVMVVALSVALIGIAPLTWSKHDPGDADAVKRFKHRLLNRRVYCLIGSALIMVLGFVIGLIGLSK